MTPVVSGEHATATWLTGLTGLLVLAAAVVMMVAAAPAPPAPAPPVPHHTAAQAATPSMIAESWSAISAGFH
jgi:hypothetical protein